MKLHPNFNQERNKTGRISSGKSKKNLLDSMPSMKEKRRPYVDDALGEPGDFKGYVESDRDYMENNWEAAVWFLDNYDEIKKRLEK